MLEWIIYNIFLVDYFNQAIFTLYRVLCEVFLEI